MNSQNLSGTRDQEHCSDNMAIKSTVHVTNADLVVLPGRMAS